MPGEGPGAALRLGARRWPTTWAGSCAASRSGPGRPARGRGCRSGPRRKPAVAALVAVSGRLRRALVAAGVLVYHVQLRAGPANGAEDNEAEARRQQEPALPPLPARAATRSSDAGPAGGRRLAEVPAPEGTAPGRSSEDALAFYQAPLEEQDNPDPGVRLDAAMAYRRAADIQQALGRLRDAADNYRRAIALLENLPAEHRDAPKSERSWPAVTRTRPVWPGGGTRRLATTGPPSASTSGLAAANPADPVVRSGLAESEHNLGLVCLNARNPAEAEAHFGRAIALRTRLVHDDPDIPRVSSGAGQDYMALALLARRTSGGTRPARPMRRSRPCCRP